jgi:hypothetical protein
LKNGHDLKKSEKFNVLSACEEQVISTLMSSRSLEGGGIMLMVLDESTPREMGQILHSILTVQTQTELLLSEKKHFIMTLSSKEESEAWRRNLLERYRKELYRDPTKLVQIDITIGGAALELDVISSTELTTFKIFKSLEDKLHERLARNHEEPTVEVTSITGALFNFMHDFNPREYVQEDYPLEPGIEQWEAQKPLGRKTIVQYDKGEGQVLLDSQSFVGLVDSVLKKTDVYEFEVYTDIGDGVAIVSDAKLGSVVATWDGRNHVDLNIYMHDDTEYEIEQFLKEFNKKSKKYMNQGLRDDFPRGIGRVMNFRADMTYDGFDSIVELEPYVDLD